MDPTKEIFRLFSQTDKTLVFTSETVARNYLETYTIQNPGKAIFLDRAISWDSFKSLLMDIGNRKPASDMARRVFTESYLSTHELGELHHFASPLFPESKEAFSRLIAKNLPYFTLDKGHWIPEDIYHDMAILRPLYEKFLEENNLFEERYETKDLTRIVEGQFVLVYPETFSDSFVPEVIASGKVGVLSLPENKPEPMRVYKNSLSEIRDVMRTIQELRKTKGEEEIVISSPSLDTYRPHMEKEAAIRDIKLNFTSRKKFTAYPEGRFFLAIAKCNEEEWTLDAAKELLLDPAFPYCEKETMRSIIALMVDLCLNDGGIDHVKKAFLHKAGKYSEFTKEKDLLLDMIALLKRMTNAPSPQLLSVAIRDWRDKFFQKDAWNEKEDRLFGSILEITSDMAVFNHDFGTRTFPFFLSLLKEKTYVENNIKALGIKVYSYPASCALLAPYHFVIGLDDKNTSRVVDDHPYLPDDMKFDDRDIGKDVLRGYALKTAGFTSILSGTTEGFDGARLLPTLFLDNHEKIKVVKRDFLKAEMENFDGKTPKEKPSQKAKESYEKAKDSFVFHQKNRKKVPYEGSRLDISVSNIKNYDKCFFAGFASTILSLREKDYDVNMFDARVLGDILHGSVQKALEEVGRLSDIDPVALRDNLRKISIRKLVDYKLPSEAVRINMVSKYEDNIEKILFGKKSEAFNQATLVGNEIKVLEHKLSDEIFLTGRVDTVLRDTDGTLVIIDYKTSGKNDYKANDLDKTSLQVYLYSEMLEDNKARKTITKYVDGVKTEEEVKLEDERVGKGTYYSFNDQDFNVVWPEIQYKSGKRTYTQGSSTATAKCNGLLRTNAITQYILEGENEPKDDDENCSDCMFRRLCRERFTAR